MIRIFLSLPMSGKTDEEILESIKDMISYVSDSKIFGDQEIGFIHNFGCKPEKTSLEEAKVKPLLYLGEAISKLAFCDLVVLGKGWEHARGCVIENAVAKEYGIPVISIETVKEIANLRNKIN